MLHYTDVIFINFRFATFFSCFGVNIVFQGSYISEVLKELRHFERETQLYRHSPLVQPRDESGYHLLMAHEAPLLTIDVSPQLHPFTKQNGLCCHGDCDDHIRICHSLLD